jgi:hypothetical protein
LDNGSRAKRARAALPGMLLGIGLALIWYFALGYAVTVGFYSVIFGAADILSWLTLLSPPISILALAATFSFFQKHNVVNGILLVAIAFGVRITYPIFRAAYIWHFHSGK